MPKGHHYINVPLNELVFFIRKGKAIPFGKAVANTTEIVISELSLIGYEDSRYELYSDNGYSPSPDVSLNKIVL